MLPKIVLTFHCLNFCKFLANNFFSQWVRIILVTKYHCYFLFLQLQNSRKKVGAIKKNTFFCKSCFLESDFSRNYKKSFRKCNCKAITNWSKIQLQFIESFNTQYMRNSTLDDLVKMESVSKITISWPKNEVFYKFLFWNPSMQKIIFPYFIKQKIFAQNF